VEQVSKIRSARSYLIAVAPLVPVALACLSGSMWSASLPWSMGLILLAFLSSRPQWIWWAAVVVVSILVSWRAALLEKPVKASLAEARSEFVEGILTVGRQSGPFAGERYGKLREGESERKVIVMKAQDYQPGQVLEIRGKFFVPDRERNPGVFPRLDLWERGGVHGGLAVREEKQIRLNWYSAPLRWAESLRESLHDGITRGLSEESNGRAVIQAMVLGEKPPGDSEVSRAFRESGAMHVFAVSGLHVTLVGGIFWMVLMYFPIPRRGGVFIVILAMVTYAFVTGLRPPAIRATVMAVCFLGAYFLRRRPSLFNALALSLVLVVFWKPSQVHEVGFQLSYGVLLAIGLGVGVALKFTGKIAELDPFFPSRLLTDGQRRVMAVRTYFANLGASSLAAWLGSLPIMIWHFGVVTPIAVFASLILIPATLVILALGFFATIVGVLNPVLGSGVNQANSGVATFAYYTAKGFSKIPLGHWQSRRLTPGDWVVFDCHDGGAASFLDVEGGAMIDVGGRSFFYEQLRSILGRWNVELKTVLVTHPDGDHAGGLPQLLKRGGLEEAILPMPQARSPSYREFVARADDFGCQKILGTTGELYELEDRVWVEILREGQPSSRGIADNRIMVMKVHWKGWKVLITGDLGINDELALIEDGTDLSADVIVMGRHAWGVSGQHQFLEATGAKVVITSAGSFPSYEMPKERWLKHVRLEGYHLFNQWESGAVIMDFDEDELRLRSFLQPDDEITLQR
jgi:competence protein ComEC|tara:strand:+ start:1750 stop:3984 length:2235 start_codon:yes stop_codon:yes gene_type:complete